ncbi:MAG: hypothetical protein Fur0015_06630 [Ignavibacteriales bacterium]
MTVKVVELIVEILEALRNKISIEDLNKKINKERKFDKQTISAAFSLIFESLRIEQDLISDSKSIRIFSDEEKLFLGNENCNYLIYLLNIGLIENSELELIIEQLSLFPEDKITKEEINMLILFSIVEKNTNIIPGSRITLYSSDKIN